MCENWVHSSDASEHTSLDACASAPDCAMLRPMDAPENDPNQFALIEQHVDRARRMGAAALPLPSRRKDGFSRQDIVNEFQSAFQVIGGASRLALWANSNPDRFYALYTKLFPSTTLALGAGSILEIIHALPKTGLDQHKDWDKSSQDVDAR